MMIHANITLAHPAQAGHPASLVQTWDYVFDVDWEDGAAPKKLALNRGDNPYDVADRFLAQEDLPASYRLAGDVLLHIGPLDRSWWWLFCCVQLTWSLIHLSIAALYKLTTPARVSCL